MSSHTRYRIFGVVIAVVAVIAGYVTLFPPYPYPQGALDGFAQCLAAKGAVMYGASWCPHCNNEKHQFGDSFQFVPYVECPSDPQRCLVDDIKGYPTWVFASSSRYEGEQGLEKLSEESGCPLPVTK